MKDTIKPVATAEGIFYLTTLEFLQLFEPICVSALKQFLEN